MKKLIGLLLILTFLTGTAVASLPSEPPEQVDQEQANVSENVPFQGDDKGFTSILNENASDNAKQTLERLDSFLAGLFS